MTCTDLIGAVPWLMLLKRNLAMWLPRTRVVVYGLWGKATAARGPLLVALRVIPLSAPRTA